MTHLYFYNNWHNGDIIFERPLVRRILARYEDVHITWGCWRNHQLLIQDLPVTTLPHAQDDRQPTDELRLMCPADHYPIYLWVGQYPDTKHTCWRNVVEVYNRQVKQHRLDLLIPCGEVPMVDFPWVDVPVKNPAVYVENGAVRSMQSRFDFDLRILSQEFPDLNFYCTADPGVQSPNVFNCGRLNLVQLSCLSNQCDALIGKGSGTFACAMTEANRFKPQALLNFHSVDGPTFWDYPGCPTQYLENYEELRAFLNQVRQPPGIDLMQSAMAPVAQPAVADACDLFFAVQRAVDALRADPEDISAGEQLRNVRLRLAHIWLNTSDSRTVQHLYGGDAGNLQRTLWEAAEFRALRDALRTPEETEFLRPTSEGAQSAGSHRAIVKLLIATLYLAPHRLPTLPDPDQVPDWLRHDFLKYSLHAPELFRDAGEAEQYAAFFAPWLAMLASKLTSPLSESRWRTSAVQLATQINMIPMYFSQGDLRPAMESRATIIEAALESVGAKLDHQFLPRKDGEKIRLGVLQMQFSAHTETYTALPVFEHLNRAAFEVLVYVLNANGNPVEQYCRSRADQFTVLPGDLASQAASIRRDNLDMLFIGTNVTAVLNPITALAAFRLAPIQLTSLNSPVTTGMRSMTHYLLAAANRPRDQIASGYTETVETIPDPGMCFAYGARPPPSGEVYSPLSLGIAADATVFISGANFFKIIPELRLAWARMVARVPNSVLVLFPFGPSWSSTYARDPFLWDIYSTFNDEGLDISRLIVVPPLPSPSDIPALLKLADVYVDSFPYAGATSIIDALEVGLPTVVMDGPHQRFGQAAALLRDIGMPELIASDESGYLQIAASLGTDVARRRAIAQVIRSKRTKTPRFLDSSLYAAQLEPILHRLARAGGK